MPCGIARNGVGSLANPVWSFTTGTNLAIDGALTRGVQPCDVATQEGGPHVRPVCAHRRPDWCCDDPDAALRRQPARARRGGSSRHPRGTAPADPDAQDAHGAGLGAWPGAAGRTGAQGQCLRHRPAASALDPRAAKRRRARRRVGGHRRAGDERLRLRDALHDAPGCRRRAQPEPDHAPARRRRRRRGRDARGLPRRAEPALRHGAGGRHLLCRQHRRDRRLPL